MQKYSSVTSVPSYRLSHHATPAGFGGWLALAHRPRTTCGVTSGKRGVTHMAGFSLIELAIVLVILGLLVGGIMSGQSLIRAAELRSVTTGLQNYQSSAVTFRDKYLALPGDMTNATAFWGKDNTNCATATGTAATPGTCNGNGNGILNWQAASAGGTSEGFQFWKQLQLAGLIEGQYTGTAGSGSTTLSTPGINIPRAKLGNNLGWLANNATNYAGDAIAYALDYGNNFWLRSDPETPYLTPEEAWNIDTKLDDGKPAYGTIIARGWDNTPANPTCAAADDGSNANNDLNASYRLSDKSLRCQLMFIKLF
jgi:prepilin-type N-terminal cleavage/methylation domain-containing protein